jgi:hypothetical protein|tara:strand:- start:195 stop:404 length:210 start_codon:yes stop_codon:yes gene_type:complete
MDTNEQTDALLFELQNAVNRFRSEFDLNHATIIGCLEMVKLDYLTEPSDDEVMFDADDDLLNDEENEDF